MNTATPINLITCHLMRERLGRRHCRVGEGRESPHPSVNPLHRAAVLLPLYQIDGAWHLVFIRRALQVRDRHSGEVGFPGGRWQASDPDCIATALREAWEEISLPRDSVLVLGELSPLCTVSEFLVTPVVGCIPWPQDLRPDAREVARIFSIPLDWLSDPAHYQVRVYPAPDHPEARELVFFEPYDGEHLWGITARITLDFLTCLQS